METDLILQQPVTVDGAELLLLFHGVGSSAQDLRPTGSGAGSRSATGLGRQRALTALGVSSTLDRFPGLGHGIDARVVDSILQR